MWNVKQMIYITKLLDTENRLVVVRGRGWGWVKWLNCFCFSLNILNQKTKKCLEKLTRQCNTENYKIFLSDNKDDLNECRDILFS